ncbi:MAG: type II toxin-antitoxin system HicA family toxin [Chloroflexi bacterium]|nr:type II toxin-antitoxin system HicA family toxin [Chloroflexota bacterium]
MSKLPAGVTGEQLYAAFLRAGWRLIRIRGSHAILGHPTDDNRRVLIARHRTPVPVGTLATIRRESGYTVAELRRLL